MTARKVVGEGKQSENYWRRYFRFRLIFMGVCLWRLWKMHGRGRRLQC